MGVILTYSFGTKYLAWWWSQAFVIEKNQDKGAMLGIKEYASPAHLGDCDSRA
jgi:hypothetical protein